MAQKKVIQDNADRYPLKWMEEQSPKWLKLGCLCIPVFSGAQQSPMVMPTKNLLLSLHIKVSVSLQGSSQQYAGSWLISMAG